MLTVMSNTLNPALTVTNQTAEPILLANVKDSPKSGLDAYAQQLTVVSEIIANQGQGKVILNQPDQVDYNLIGMRSKDLFPVASRVAVTPINCSNHPSPKCTGGISQYYADLTIAPVEAESMHQALKFRQSISAFPGLEPGLSFTKLLIECKQDLKNAESRVNAFFHNTKNYQKCTLESFIAIQSYCLYYAFAWANFQDSFTYEVAQVNSDLNADSGLVTVGTVVFTKKTNAPNPADINDRNGGYDISYHPVKGRSIPLDLVDGTLASTDDSTNPAVRLFFTYGLKSDFTGNGADNVTWPVLMGGIDQAQVIAVGAIKPIDSPVMAAAIKISTDWKKFYSPKTAADWAKTIGLTAGVASALGLLALSVYYAVKVVKQGKSDGDARVEDFENGVLDDNARWAAVFKSKNVAFDQDIYKKTEYEKAAEAAQKSQIETRETKIKAAYKQAAEFQRNLADLIGEYGEPASLNAAYNNLDQLDDLLKQFSETDWDTFKAQLPAIKEKVKLASNDLTDATKALQSKLSSEVLEDIRTGEIYINVPLEVAGELEQDMEDIGDDTNPIEE